MSDRSIMRDVPPPPSPIRRIGGGLLSTLRYMMQTEVHVYAFSIAANVLLSFFPFLIVCMSVGSLVFNRETMIQTMDMALRDFFPSALGNLLHNNLPKPQHIEFLSLGILLFSANGIFEPLEVALNRAWGIRKNRSFLRNQLISLILIFVCGGLAMLSLGLTAFRATNATDWAMERWVSALLFKTAAVPITVLILFLIYRFLPNGRPPVQRVLPAAIVVGVLLEVFKSLNVWLWPALDEKMQREYNIFRYSATLIFMSFLTSIIVLGGAEWSARGNKLDGVREGMIDENEDNVAPADDTADEVTPKPLTMKDSLKDKQPPVSKIDFHA